jgi:hypothetical protein
VRNGDVALSAIREPTKAKAGEHCHGGIIEGKLAGIGPLWLEVERAMGIEPTAQAWEAWVLPLYDARFALI